MWKTNHVSCNNYLQTCCLPKKKKYLQTCITVKGTHPQAINTHHGHQHESINATDKGTALKVDHEKRNSLYHNPLSTLTWKNLELRRGDGSGGCFFVVPFDELFAMAMTSFQFKNLQWLPLKISSET